MLSAIFVYEFGMPQFTMDLKASLGYAALVKNVTASCVQSCIASYQNVYVHTKRQFNVLADNILYNRQKGTAHNYIMLWC